MSLKKLAADLAIAHAKSIMEIGNFARVELSKMAHDNFRSASYLGDPWPPRKRVEQGKQRALLVETGRMRRSLRAEFKGGRAAVYMTREAGNYDVAKGHNEGDGRLPKRQVIPHPGGDAAFLKKLDAAAAAIIKKNLPPPTV